MIRTPAVPVILAWIALIAVLNVTVPQLEVVGQNQAVSMSPDAAPSMIAMKRIGPGFSRRQPDSLAMIVLEGEQPLATRPTPSTTRWWPGWKPTPSTWSRSKISGATTDRGGAQSNDEKAVCPDQTGRQPG